MPASTISPSRAFTSLALVVSVSAVTACSGFSSGESNDDSAPAHAPARGDEPAPKAPPVTGTPDASQLNETFGVFVAPSGQPGAAGSREHPLSTIRDGIDLGKRSGKRVYVCTGTFREAIVLADSISIIGGLDCSGSQWRVGAPHTRIEAPASPAVRAKDIVAPTRLEGLDILAPAATAPSGSSIGLLAEHSAALVIAASKITAGDGADGVDGTEGTQLTQAGSTQGAGSAVEAECVNNVTCARHPVAAINPWIKPAGGKGGSSICAGAPGHDGLPGGNGGSGGLFQSVGGVWHYYAESQLFAPEYGQFFNGAAGLAGTSGAPSGAVGTLSAAGYVATDGAPGTNGAPGNGGFGGRGSGPTKDASRMEANIVWRGAGGPGGGTEGCPGLAGTAGTGGGGSIAVALIDSPIVVDGAQLASGRAGAGGHGTFGSDPTAGGIAGTNVVADPVVGARPGGNGGAPGISTNGDHGPSVGVLHSGAAPSVKGATKITPGAAAPSTNASSRTDALGNARTIPATLAGISKDILAL